MIKEASDIQKVTKEKVCGGEGSVDFIYYYDEEDFLGRGRLYGLAILEPGSSIGIHTHEGEDESYIIYEGEGLYNDNGEEVVIGPGTLTLCKDGESHGIKNIGEGPLRIGLLILNT